MFKVEIIGRILNFKQETIVAILHCKNNNYLKLIYKIVLEALKINSSVLILDCSYSFREEILRNLCKEHKIHLDFLESRLKKIVVRKETQFLSILRLPCHLVGVDGTALRDEGSFEAVRCPYQDYSKVGQRR